MDNFQNYSVRNLIWKDEQKNRSPEKMIKWSLDQGIPLSVYIETEDGWEFADYYNVVGPLAAKEDVLEIDLSKIKGDKVNIKLEFGFLFWEIDYVAMDFTPNHSVEKHTVSLFSAFDENNNDVSDKLMFDDKNIIFSLILGIKHYLRFRFQISLKVQNVLSFYIQRVIMKF